MAREPLFFVVGTGRCGSTLLQSMLASHPRLYIPPELRYFGPGDPASAFSDPLRDDQVEPYLSQLRATALDLWWQDMGVAFDAFAAEVRHGLRASRDIYLWVLEHVAAARRADKPRLGDKTPYYALFAERILTLFPDAQFIHLYRDPRDVAASFLGQYWCAAGTALRCAGFIQHTYQCMERLANSVGPRQYCAVQYEALVRNPEAELRRLCAFLGEPYDPAMLRYGDRKDPGYLAVEEDWKGLTQKELTETRIGRFEDTLSPHQIWTIERLLGPRLVQMGYAPSAGRGLLTWRIAFWLERFYLKVRRTLGLHQPLLDEQAVLNQRNVLKRAEAAGAA